MWPSFRPWSAEKGVVPTSPADGPAATPRVSEGVGTPEKGGFFLLKRAVVQRHEQGQWGDVQHQSELSAPKSPGMKNTLKTESGGSTYETKQGEPMSNDEVRGSVPDRRDPATPPGPLISAGVPSPRMGIELKGIGRSAAIAASAFVTEPPSGPPAAAASGEVSSVKSPGTAFSMALAPEMAVFPPLVEVDADKEAGTGRQEDVGDEIEGLLDLEGDLLKERVKSLLQNDLEGQIARSCEEKNQGQRTEDALSEGSQDAVSAPHLKQISDEFVSESFVRHDGFDVDAENHSFISPPSPDSVLDNEDLEVGAMLDTCQCDSNGTSDLIQPEAEVVVSDEKIHLSPGDVFSDGEDTTGDDGTLKEAFGTPVTIPMENPVLEASVPKSMQEDAESMLEGGCRKTECPESLTEVSATVQNALACTPQSHVLATDATSDAPRTEYKTPTRSYGGWLSNLSFSVTKPVSADTPIPAAGPVPVEEFSGLQGRLATELQINADLRMRLEQAEEQRIIGAAQINTAMEVLKQKELELHKYQEQYHKNLEAKKQEMKNRARRRVEHYEKNAEDLQKEMAAARAALKHRNEKIDKMRQDFEANVAAASQALQAEKEKHKSTLQKMYQEIQMFKELWGMFQHSVSEEVSIIQAGNASYDSCIRNAIGSFLGEHEDLKKRYMVECKERRQLYNKVLELKGNIRVFCRCRPLSQAELVGVTTSVTEFDTNRDGDMAVRTSTGRKCFKFDRVFGPESSQEEIFADTAPVVTSVLDGYNVCIFAYGQTGTGKTFTMEGVPGNRGVNFRTLEELFRMSAERQGEATYNISVSVLEVYNENIRDLLAAPGKKIDGAKKLEVKQLSESGHHVYVPGLTETAVESMGEVWEVLQNGSRNRAVGATNANEHSSRSHCLLCVSVRGENKLTGEVTRSKLWLIDLAGSERIAKSEVTGDRLKETQAINKSLSALGDVVSALMTKSSHVPFRNSKLTHLLQDSLGGDSKALMFVQISPNEADVSETVCSLNFASRVKGVELGPAKRQMDGTELFKYKQMVTTSKQEVRLKDEAVRKLEEQLRVAENKLKAKDSALQAQTEKTKEKERAIAEMEVQLAMEKKAVKEAKILAERTETALKEQQQATAEEREAAARDAAALQAREIAAREAAVSEARETAAAKAREAAAAEIAELQAKELAAREAAAAEIAAVEAAARVAVAAEIAAVQAKEAAARDALLAQAREREDVAKRDGFLLQAHLPAAYNTSSTSTLAGGTFTQSHGGGSVSALPMLVMPAVDSVIRHDDRVQGFQTSDLPACHLASSFVQGTSSLSLADPIAEPVPIIPSTGSDVHGSIGGDPSATVTEGSIADVPPHAKSQKIVRFNLGVSNGHTPGKSRVGLRTQPVNASIPGAISHSSVGAYKIPVTPTFKGSGVSASWTASSTANDHRAGNDLSSSRLTQSMSSANDELLSTTGSSDGDSVGETNTFGTLSMGHMSTPGWKMSLGSGQSRTGGFLHSDRDRAPLTGLKTNRGDYLVRFEEFKKVRHTEEPTLLQSTVGKQLPAGTTMGTSATATNTGPEGGKPPRVVAARKKPLFTKTSGAVRVRTGKKSAPVPDRPLSTQEVRERGWQ